MQGFDRKKINFIIIFIFGYFSIYNISKFNSYESLKAAYDEDLNELTDDISFDENSQGFDIDEKLRLTKKKDEEITEVSNKLEVAKYTDQDISSDYIDDEKNLNLSLIPIFETMLFSGIPNPKLKPIPERDEIFKSTAVTVKNKKSLNETLKKFLNKKEAELVFERVNDFIDYKIEENLKLMSDESDQIIEINTYIKDYRQLNSRRNKNKDFVFYYQDAPTETKVIRKRMKVKNSQVAL